MRRFKGVVAYEDFPTGDGRIIETLIPPRELPLPALWLPPRKGEPIGHEGSVICGEITAAIFSAADKTLSIRGLIVLEDAITACENVQHYLQADMDELGDNPRQTEAGIVFPTARLRSVHLGTNPAWTGTELVWE